MTLPEEAVSLCSALLAVSPVYAEGFANGREALRRLNEQGIDTTNKYIATGSGFVWHSHGVGRWFRSLPDGVPDSAVIHIDTDWDQKPLQDRLVVVQSALIQASNRGELRSEAQRALRFAANTMRACTMKGYSCVFSSRRELADLDSALAKVMQAHGSLAIDGYTTASLRVVRDICKVIAASIRDPQRGQQVSYQQIAIPEELDANPSEGIRALVETGIANGFRPEIEGVADSHTDAGEEMIERALQSRPGQFYGFLSDAAIRNVAALLTARSLRSLPAQGPAADARWRNREKVAEEYVVRIGLSFCQPVWNIDGSTWARDWSGVQWLLKTEGIDAARERAVELVENFLFYPRWVIPILLSEKPPQQLIL